MPLLLHSTIIATSLAATIAVGVASASINTGPETEISAKTDRLPIVANAGSNYMIFETRQDGVSVMSRMPFTN